MKLFRAPRPYSNLLLDSISRARLVKPYAPLSLHNFSKSTRNSTMPNPSRSSTLPPSTPSQASVSFQVSSIPQKSLGEGNYIRTAAALIIGDEILNGKTLDRNSHCFAQYCFENGIDLKRIEVIADNEGEIVEASRRLVEKYDFVVTSGGIGPTHDDITYESLATAFGQKLVHHQETIHRMREMNKYRKWVGMQNAEQLAATHRMALFPDEAEVIYTNNDIWVPVVRLVGKLCVFPGIPALFKKMLHGLTPFLPLPPKKERPLRIQIFTARPESMIAPYLTSLQERMRPHGIQVGSYPVLYKGVFVSLIGRDLDSKVDGAAKVWLAEVAREVEKEIGGRVASEEEIAAHKKECVPSEPPEKEASGGTEHTQPLKAKY